MVCNHLSFADGLILGTLLPRPARFVLYNRYAKIPVLGALLRWGGCIPIDGEGGRKALLRSIDASVEAAQRGEVVIIFPEGKLTRSGLMDTFARGMERIAERASVPVVPAATWTA